MADFPTLRYKGRDIVLSVAFLLLLRALLTMATTWFIVGTASVQDVATHNDACSLIRGSALGTGVEAHGMGPLGGMPLVMVSRQTAIIFAFQVDTHRVHEWSIQARYAAPFHGLETQQAVSNPGGIQSCNLA